MEANKRIKSLSSDVVCAAPLLSPLESLPAEVLVIIFGFLPGYSFSRILAVSKTLRAVGLLHWGTGGRLLQPSEQRQFALDRFLSRPDVRFIFQTCVPRQVALERFLDASAFVSLLKGVERSGQVVLGSDPLAFLKSEFSTFRALALCPGCIDQVGNGEGHKQCRFGICGVGRATAKVALHEAQKTFRISPPSHDIGSQKFARIKNPKTLAWIEAVDEQVVIGDVYERYRSFGDMAAIRNESKLQRVMRKDHFGKFAKDLENSLLQKGFDLLDLGLALPLSRTCLTTAWFSDKPLCNAINRYFGTVKNGGRPELLEQVVALFGEAFAKGKETEQRIRDFFRTLSLGGFDEETLAAYTAGKSELSREWARVHCVRWYLNHRFAPELGSMPERRSEDFTQNFLLLVEALKLARQQFSKSTLEHFDVFPHITSDGRTELIRTMGYFF